MVFMVEFVVFDFIWSDYSASSTPPAASAATTT
jgi:hypothetical protein